MSNAWSTPSKEITVNTAARLESFFKDRFVLDLFNRPCRILIGEATLEYLDDRFQTEQVGQVRLRGKDQEVPSFVCSVTKTEY